MHEFDSPGKAHGKFLEQIEAAANTTRGTQKIGNPFGNPEPELGTPSGVPCGVRWECYNTSGVPCVSALEDGTANPVEKGKERIVGHGKRGVEKVARKLEGHEVRDGDKMKQKALKVQKADTKAKATQQCRIRGAPGLRMPRSTMKQANV